MAFKQQLNHEILQVLRTLNKRMELSPNDFKLYLNLVSGAMKGKLTLFRPT